MPTRRPSRRIGHLLTIALVALGCQGAASTADEAGAPTSSASSTSSTSPISTSTTSSTSPATSPGPSAAAGSSACDRESAVLARSAFVIVTSPAAGDDVTSGFEVAGCSRTFESTVVWRLLARNGGELASGHTRGGGVDGPGPFSFPVDYELESAQLGHLEVFEEDASGGEGFPPSRNVLPLVLH